MKSLTYTLLTYAFIIFAGGLIGFIKAESIASLVMSSIFASIIVFCTFLMSYRFKIGFYAAFSLIMILCTFFAYRFFLLQKFMPSGFMLLISLLTIAKLLFTKNEQELCKKIN